MLSATNIRNQNFKLKENDIYIGDKWDVKGINEGFIVPPYGMNHEEFYYHISENCSYDNALYKREIDVLISYYTSSLQYNLVCWDVRLGKAIIRIIEEILEEKSYLSEKNVMKPDNFNLDAWLKEQNIKSITDCQKKALEIYLDFLYNSSEQSMLLTGGGGVGKSWLMELMIKLVDNKAVILSPKHKIKKLHNDKDVLLNTTYQSFFGIRPNLKKADTVTGKIPYEIISYEKTLIKVKEACKDASIIIFEECSMIEENVYEIIFKFIPENIKIIFVGDNAQIKPIGENVSKTITETTIKAELKTVVRYSGELLNFCIKIREEILKESHTFSFHKKVNDSSMIITLNSKVKVLSVFEKSFNDGKDIRILCYSNQSMESYNKILNEILFESQLQSGNDYFIGQKLIHNSKSEDFKPCSRLDLVETKSGRFFKQQSTIDKFDEITITDIDYCKDTLLSELNSLDLVTQFYYGEFESCYELKRDVDIFGGVSKFIDKVLMKSFYWNFITGTLENGKEIELRSIHSDSLTNYLKTIQYFKSNKLWMIVNFIQSMNDWLQPSLSLTIDQSQGSTYQEIILDTSGIQNRENINRYYVGITRAKERLYLI